jgi:hypothetical protein
VLLLYVTTAAFLRNSPCCPTLTSMSLVSSTSEQYRGCRCLALASTLPHARAPLLLLPHMPPAMLLWHHFLSMVVPYVTKTLLLQVPRSSFYTTSMSRVVQRHLLLHNTCC